MQRLNGIVLVTRAGKGYGLIVPAVIGCSSSLADNQGRSASRSWVDISVLPSLNHDL